MTVSKRKEPCLTDSDHLDSEGLLFTKRVKSSARLIPADNTCQDLMWSVKDKIQIRGDILTTGIESDAQS